MSEPGYAHFLPLWRLPPHRVESGLLAGGERRAFAAHAHCGTAREPGLGRVWAGAPAGPDAKWARARSLLSALTLVLFEKPPQLRSIGLLEN